jgi:hypothetical protein
MQVKLKLDGRMASGGSALIVHNERLADPMDSFVQALQAITSKRRKTLEDHAEIARLEFLGGLYTDPVMSYPVNGAKPVPVVPAWNILRCLQDGGKRHRRGVDVPRGVYPLQQFAALQYEGPTDPQELWKDGSFALRKSVGVQRSRTMRTRPIFHEWQTDLLIEVDPVIFDVHTLKDIWKSAGVYAGLGEMRPIWGRFDATLEIVKEAKKS